MLCPPSSRMNDTRIWPFPPTNPTTPRNNNNLNPDLSCHPNNSNLTNLTKTLLLFNISNNNHSNSILLVKNNNLILFKSGNPVRGPLPQIFDVNSVNHVSLQ